MKQGLENGENIMLIIQYITNPLHLKKCWVVLAKMWVKYECKNVICKKKKNIEGSVIIST